MNILHYIIFTTIVLSKLTITHGNGISTLRVRLLTGELIRLDLDNSTETIAHCYEKLIFNGKVEAPISSSITENEKFEIKGTVFHVTNTTNVRSLGLKNGDIINLLSQSKTLPKVSSDSKNLTSPSPLIGSNEQKLHQESPISTKQKPTENIQINSNKKKNIASIASLQAKKNSLIKITRQKPSKTANCVYVNPKAASERIMNRLTEYGGLGILLGKIETQFQPQHHDKKSKSSSSSSSSISSIISNKKLKNMRVSSDDSAMHSRNVTCIEAIYEVFKIPSDLYQNSHSHYEKSHLFFKQLQSCNIPQIVQNIQNIIRPLRLDIVGFCINTGFDSLHSSSKNEPKKSMKPHANKNKKSNLNLIWTTEHVYLSSFFRHLLIKSSSSDMSVSNLLKEKFPIILCVSKVTNSNSATSSTTIKTKASNQKTSSSSSSSLGLSIEAFQLSDQTIKLIDENYLTYTNTIDEILRTISLLISTTTKKLVKKSKDTTKSLKTSKTENYNEDQPLDTMIQLDKEILIKNEETKLIDPLLMVVPLPIIYKQPIFTSSTTTTTTNTNNNNNNNNNNNKIHHSISMKHSFPTQNEILINSDMSTLAKKYMQQILIKLKKTQMIDKTISEKLLDIHILLYLYNLLDKETIENIVNACVQVAVVDINNNSNSKSVKLGSRSIMALQMLISSSSSDSSEQDDL